MTTLISQLVLSLALTGILAGLAVTLATGRLTIGVGLLLDFLLAAGLLRLLLADTWSAIGSVAVVVALRRLLSGGLHADSVRGHLSRDSSASAS
jgi:hypothetical protein